MFDLYPRHGHRTPDQIAEDTGGSFEPARIRRGARELFDEPRTTSAESAATADVGAVGHVATVRTPDRASTSR